MKSVSNVWTHKDSSQMELEYAETNLNMIMNNVLFEHKRINSFKKSFGTDAVDFSDMNTHVNGCRSFLIPNNCWAGNSWQKIFLHFSAVSYSEKSTKQFLLFAFFLHKILFELERTDVIIILTLLYFSLFSALVSTLQCEHFRSSKSYFDALSFVCLAVTLTAQCSQPTFAHTNTIQEYCAWLHIIILFFMVRSLMSLQMNSWPEHNRQTSTSTSIEKH